MRLPKHKTKIVCTIGPASRSEAVLERLMLLGMNVRGSTLPTGPWTATARTFGVSVLWQKNFKALV